MSTRKYEIHPYRLSDSTLSTFYSCEKKFQLTRLCVVDAEQREQSAAAIRGGAFGVGVQTYLLTGDINLAIFRTWLAYWPMVEDRPYVSCSRTINNLIVVKPHLDKLLERYEVAYFNDKPAIELSFRLNKAGSKWHFVGYIDVVMWDRYEKMYVVFELKTTGYKLHDLEPVYKNQAQALAYSIIIDKVAGSEQSRYGVVYLVVRDKGKDPVPDVYTFNFAKTLTDRLKWFVAYGLDVQRLEQLEELDLWPMRGKSCVSFNRPCHLYGNCQMESLTHQKRPIPEIEETYDFVFDLDEIVDEHLARVSLPAPAMEEPETMTLEDL